MSHSTIGSDSTQSTNVNNSITPLFPGFYPVAYNAREASYFQQFDGQEPFPDFIGQNYDYDVIGFIDQELAQYAGLCVEKIDGLWHVCYYQWETETLFPLVPCMNRGSAYATAIALMSRDEGYQEDANEPLPFETKQGEEKLADWNAKVRATLKVVDKAADRPQADGNGGGE